MNVNNYGFIVNDRLDNSMGYLVPDSLAGVGEMIPARLAPVSMGYSWDEFVEDIKNPGQAIEDAYKNSAVYQSLSSIEKGVIDVIGVDNYNKVISKIQDTPIGQAITNPSDAMAAYISAKSGVSQADIMNGSAVIIKNADGSITVQRSDGSMISTGSNNTALYVAIGGASILLAGVVWFLIKRAKKGKKGKRK